MKKSLKKMVICFFMMVGIMGAVAVPTEAKSHVNYTKIYKKFAKKQVKKKKKKFVHGSCKIRYTSIINYGSCLGWNGKYGTFVSIP